VTAKPSICGRGALCKSGVYAVTVACLTSGDLPGASGYRSWALKRLALNTVEKSAEGIVDGRQAALVRHSEAERWSNGYAAAVRLRSKA